MQNVTDLSSCTGAPPAGASPIGKWMANYADSHGQIALQFTISNGNFAVKSTCLQSNGGVLSANASAAASLQNGSMVVPTGDSNTTCRMTDPLHVPPESLKELIVCS